METLPYFWTRETLSAILGREEYLGHTVNLRTRTKSYKDKRKVDNPKEDWLIFKNTQEAIIDQETFDIVRKMRNHKRSNQRYKNRAGHENLFAGIVFCGTCGRKHYFCPQEKMDSTTTITSVLATVSRLMVVKIPTIFKNLP